MLVECKNLSSGEVKKSPRKTNLSIQLQSLHTIDVFDFISGISKMLKKKLP